MGGSYESVIGRVKVDGSCMWKLMGSFLKNMFKGWRDYVKMVGEKMSLGGREC